MSKKQEYEVLRDGEFVQSVDAICPRTAIVKHQEDYEYNKYGQAGAVSSIDQSNLDSYLNATFTASPTESKNGDICEQCDDSPCQCANIYAPNAG